MVRNLLDGAAQFFQTKMHLEKPASGFVLLASLMSVMCNAQAEWVEIDRGNIQMTYADPSSIDNSGSKISLWLLTSYQAPRKYDDSKFQSLLAQYEYDCRAEKIRMTAYSLYSDKFAKGAAVHSEAVMDKWKSFAKNSPDESLWKKLCTPDAGWSKVGESERMVVFANPYTARRKNGKVKMWELFDFRSAQQRKENKYLSVRHLAEYDCNGKLYRTLEVAYHPDNMGKGKAVADDDKAGKWEAVVPGSADQVFWGMVCSGVVEP